MKLAVKANVQLELNTVSSMNIVESCGEDAAGCLPISKLVLIKFVTLKHSETDFLEQSARVFATNTMTCVFCIR